MLSSLLSSLLQGGLMDCIEHCLAKVVTKYITCMALPLPTKKLTVQGFQQPLLKACVEPLLHVNGKSIYIYHCKMCPLWHAVNGCSLCSDKVWAMLVIVVMMVRGNAGIVE